MMIFFVLIIVLVFFVKPFALLNASVVSRRGGIACNISFFNQKSVSSPI